MDILILTGKFGMGHTSAARSLGEQLTGEGHHVHVTDLFDCSMPDLAPALYRGFDLMVTYGGGVYNLIHQLTQNGGGENPLIGCLAAGLSRLLGEFRPNLVLSTHPACSGAMSRLKTCGVSDLPLITCVTDVTDHSEWLYPGTDYYLAATDGVRRGLAAKGADPDRVVVTGVPVRGSFSAGAPRQDGVRELLIMGGGLGLMPRGDGFYQALNDLAGVHTTILTGSNQKLYRRLAGAYPHIEAVPFTDQVPRYMARAHLMLSKPGGVTTFEAIASRLPMLAWEPFLAQERENAQFLVSGGMGRIVPKEEAACLAAIRETIYDDGALNKMRAAMDKIASALRPQAVGQVVRQAVAETACRTSRGEVCA